MVRLVVVLVARMRPAGTVAGVAALSGLSSRRTVLLVARTSGPQEPVGGIEVMLLRLAERLSVQHEVVLASRPDPAASDAVTVRSGERFSRFEPASVASLDAAARSCDLVMVNQRRELVTVPERTVLMLHGGIEHCYPADLVSDSSVRALRAELAGVAAVAACSTWAAGTFADVLGRDVAVLYPPVDPAFAQARAAKRPVAGYSGRLDWHKGADLALEVARHPSMAGMRVEVTHLAASSDAAAPFVAAGRDGVVSLVGPFRDAAAHAAHLASLSVVLVPSRVEGFGLLAAEAQASGTFVVASRVGGLPEAVDPRAGVLTNGSVSALVDALVEHAGRVVPLQVRRDVAARFSVDQAARDLLALV